MKSRASVIERIQKLQALGRSPNVHEARIARRRADALKKRHRIRQSEIDRVPGSDHRVDLGYESADPYWRTELARAVADRRRCSLRRKDGCLAFEGKQADRAARQYHHLATETIRACQRSWWTEAKGRAGSIYLVWSTTFRAEAVRATARRLLGLTDAAPRPGRWDGPSVVVGVSEVAPAPEKKKGSKTPEQAQLERASRELARLVADLTPAIGLQGAHLFAVDLVQRAGAAGRAFGETVYLGDVLLVGGDVSPTAVREPSSLGETISRMLGRFVPRVRFV